MNGREKMFGKRPHRTVLIYGDSSVNRRGRIERLSTISGPSLRYDFELTGELEIGTYVDHVRK